MVRIDDLKEAVGIDVPRKVVVTIMYQFPVSADQKFQRTDGATYLIENMDNKMYKLNSHDNRREHHKNFSDGHHIFSQNTTDLFCSWTKPTPLEVKLYPPSSEFDFVSKGASFQGGTNALSFKFQSVDMPGNNKLYSSTDGNSTVHLTFSEEENGQLKLSSFFWKSTNEVIICDSLSADDISKQAKEVSRYYLQDLEAHRHQAKRAGRS